ncbi:MAG: HAMP domain-containing protein [Alphaproteobacteria bacterium]|jgi:signal transduction histidine kinase|nr:HAMP domain-containing protein [Alphaproteobacteria bacterium]MBT4085701.1 HAMP domain-containing protein [Alphaproteobacteria bacterium]MBT4543524.1 HAMP domain-containing protein [Alphaproteobacteria bacterium]MBT7747231.1 HAMP domain-containing protein [Alphaproteobacteria bacterium]
MMIFLVVGSFFVLDQLITNVITGLSERFATQQIHYDRGRTMQPLLQEIVLARKLARSPAVIAWAADEEDPIKAQRGLAELESFREIFKDGSYFFAIHNSGHYFFNDAANGYAGKQLRYTLLPDQDKDAWYYATVKNPVECQLNVNNDSELQVTKIWINCLVKDNGKVVGVIGTGIELTKFIRAVLDAHQDGVWNMFIDGNGAIQAHPDVNQIDYHTLTKDAGEKNTVYRLLSNDQSRSRLKAILEKLKSAPLDIETTTLSIDGKQTLVGIGYLKEIDWFNLTVMTPRVWALGRNFIPLASLLVIGMLLTLVFSAMVINRIVLTRIDRLDQAVDQVKGNDYALDLKDDEEDELGRLTSSFVEMAEGVQENRASLEAEIEERTKDLVVARDDAQAANRAKSEFLAMMSHDLRTPLNAVIGFSDMIQAETFGPVGDDRYATYLRDINESGQLLLSLIDVVLDISKIEAGKFDLIETEVDVPAFLQRSIKLISPQANDRHITLELECDDQAPALLCDQRPLSQIVNNLLSNAIKFSDEGQTISIKSSFDTTRGYVIRVTDDGIGMDETDIHKALEPFSQADASRARNQEGTGLGLYVSRLLMGQHGGTLEIDSAPDEGTTVTVTFPPERIINS